MNPATGVHNDFIFGLRVFQGISCVVGTFGAVMTLIAYATHKSLRTIPNAYLVNLAVADLVVCSCLLPMSMYTTGTPLADDVCPIVGYPNLVVLMTSVVNLSLVAINRYIVVCRSRELYSRIYTWRNTIISVVGAWVVCLLLFSPPFMGLGKYGYNIKFGACIFMSDDYETYWFVFGFADCTIMFPTVPVTVFCYVKILLKFYQSRKKVGTVAGGTTTMEATTSEASGSATDATSTSKNNRAASNNVSTLQKSKDRESKSKMFSLIKNMFVIWITFLTCWMPLVLVYKIDYHAQFHNEIYHILFAFAQSNSAINFLIYCSMNKNFRDAYLNILKCKVCKKGNNISSF